MSSTTPARRRKPLPPSTSEAAKKTEAAYRVFETSGDGQTVLADLCESYMDRSSFVPGDSHATAFNEGQRSVVLAIFALLEGGRA